MLKIEDIKTVHELSAFWFFVFAFFYAAMVLALRNDYLASTFLSLMRTLDIPFAFISLLYGGSTLLLQVNSPQEEEIRHPLLTWVIMAVCLLLFSIVAFVNWLLPATI